MMPPIPAVRALLPYVMWTPALAWIAPPLVWLIAGGGWGFAAIATLVSLLTWIIIYAVESAPVWYALLYPLGAGVVAFIMLRSAVRGRRLVEWRGPGYRGQKKNDAASDAPPPQTATEHERGFPPDDEVPPEVDKLTAIPPAAPIPELGRGR